MIPRKPALPAWILLAALCAPAGAVPVFGAGGEGLGLIHGVIYRSDEATRLAGALVTAINVSTGRRYSSIHTGANGAYEIKGLPAGTYDIAIDTPDDNLYVTGSLIELHENQRLLLSLSLKKEGGAVPGSPSAGEAGREDGDPGTVPFQPASTGPAPAAEDLAAPDDKDSGKKNSGKKSSKEPAAQEEAKPPKKSKKKTGSGATASLRVEPAPAFTPA